MQGFGSRIIEGFSSPMFGGGGYSNECFTGSTHPQHHVGRASAPAPLEDYSVDALHDHLDQVHCTLREVMKELRRAPKSPPVAVDSSTSRERSLEVLVHQLERAVDRAQDDRWRSASAAVAPPPSVVPSTTTSTTCTWIPVAILCIVAVLLVLTVVVAVRQHAPRVRYVVQPGDVARGLPVSTRLHDVSL